MAATARAHIELLPIVLRAPAWAAAHPELANSPPAGTANFAAYLTALIKRYGPDGSFWSDNPDLPKNPIESWQIWNEPNHDHYWSDQPYAAGYVRLAKAARAAIKKADPDAVVVAAGFADRSWESISQIYRAGAKGVFDAIAIHPYTYKVSNVLRMVRYARRSLRQAGDGDRPLWLTEVTWSSGKRPGHKPYPFETTRARPGEAPRRGPAAADQPAQGARHRSHLLGELDLHGHQPLRPVRLLGAARAVAERLDPGEAGIRRVQADRAGAALSSARSSVLELATFGRQRPVGDAHDAPARGQAAPVAAAVAVEGLPGAVPGAAVDLDDQPFGWPHAVGLDQLAADVDPVVDQRLAQAGVVDQCEEATLELAAGGRRVAGRRRGRRSVHAPRPADPCVGERQQPG